MFSNSYLKNKYAGTIYFMTLAVCSLIPIAYSLIEQYRYYQDYRYGYSFLDSIDDFSVGITATVLCLTLPFFRAAYNTTKENDTLSRDLKFTLITLITITLLFTLLLNEMITFLVGLVFITITSILLYRIKDTRSYTQQYIDYENGKAQTKQSDLVYPTPQTGNNRDNNIRFDNYTRSMKVYLGFYLLGTIMFGFPFFFMIIDFFQYINLGYYTILDILFQLIVLLFPLSNLFGLYAVYRHNEWGRWIIIFGYMIMGSLLFTATFVFLFDFLRYGFLYFDIISFIFPILSGFCIHAILLFTDEYAGNFFYGALF